jgi:hypothetical protein
MYNEFNDDSELEKDSVMHRFHTEITSDNAIKIVSFCKALWKEVNNLQTAHILNEDETIKETYSFCQVELTNTIDLIKIDKLTYGSDLMYDTDITERFIELVKPIFVNNYQFKKLIKNSIFNDCFTKETFNRDMFETFIYSIELVLID